MKKNIVQVGKYYAPFIGGIENNTRQIAEALSPVYGTYVICMRPSSGPYRIRKVGCVPVIELASFGNVWRQELSAPLSKVLRKINPDCVHFHAPNPLLAFYLNHYLSNNPNVKLVITHHADLERPSLIRGVANLGYRMLLDRAEKIITYTDHAFEVSRDLHGYEAKKAVIPHGISSPLYGGGRKEAVSGGSAPFKIGYLGRLEKWKGVQVAIKAVANIPGAVLEIAGSGSYSGPLKELVKRANLSERVRFVGSQHGEQKWRFLSKLDVLILPSLNNGETFGQVLVEAQLSGIAVIASDLPTGVQEIVEKGRAGLLFPPGDDEALSRSLLQMQDDQFRKKIASYGRRTARIKFSESMARNMIVDFYNKLF